MAKRVAKSRKKNRMSTCCCCQGKDPLVQSAVKLIDQAASLLKKGVISGASRSARTRHIMKVKASTLVNKASTQLQNAIGEGAAALRKGLKKL